MVLMQPDLPEPVVPAIRMCGIRARSVHDGVAGDVLAEPDGERAGRLRQVVVDVAERDQVRAQVRHLDADRLLARDRREDRISVVASAYERSSLSAETFDIFVPGASWSS